MEGVEIESVLFARYLIWFISKREILSRLDNNTKGVAQNPRRMRRTEDINRQHLLQNRE